MCGPICQSFFFFLISSMFVVMYSCIEFCFFNKTGLALSITCSDLIASPPSFCLTSLSVTRFFTFSYSVCQYRAKKKIWILSKLYWWAYNERMSVSQMGITTVFHLPRLLELTYTHTFPLRYLWYHQIFMQCSKERLLLVNFRLLVRTV